MELGYQGGFTPLKPGVRPEIEFHILITIESLVWTQSQHELQS